MDWKTLLNSTRPRPTTSTGDHRAEFERDYDRAVFSTPVKRLQDKAQVFPLEPHDAVRTRLTHSLEVSSVARGLTMKIARWLLDKHEIEPGMERWLEAIAQTCGLIHDLGNPPFGHAGEEAIRYWFKTGIGESKLCSLLDCQQQLVQDFLLFDGNAQTIRLVSKLQILADYNGLNLTFGTLSALFKYLPTSDKTNDIIHTHSKPGYFASEGDITEIIREKTGTGKARNPIAFLVEAADDIVYSVADVEDGVKKGILSWEELKRESLDGKESMAEEAIKRMTSILKGGGEIIPSGLAGDIYASAFRTAAIGLMVASVAESFKDKYSDIMAGNYQSELVKDCSAASFVKRLKGIGRSYVYCTPPTLKLELMGRKIISDLMELFWEGAETITADKPPKTNNFPGRIGALLSENYRRVFCHFAQHQTELPIEYHRLRLVTDYVCGMTDSFAKRLHMELTNGMY